MTKTERLDAIQNFEVARANVIREQEKYFEAERKKREGHFEINFRAQI